MNTGRIALALAGLAALVTACATAPEAKPAAPPPEVVSQELEVTQDISSMSVVLAGKVKAPEDATLEKAVWELVVDGKVVKSGESPLGLPLPAGEVIPFEVGAESHYVTSAEELKGMTERGGSLLTALRGHLVVKQGAKTHQLEIARGREVRTPRLPSVKLHDMDAARYSDREANILFFLGLVNPNPFALGVGGLTYKVEIAGKVVTEGTRAAGEKVTPASTGVYEIPVSVAEDTVGAGVKDLIKSQQIPWTITGELNGDLYKVPYTLSGTVKLNVSK